MGEKIQALKVKQWLPEWDSITFDPNSFRTKPRQAFFLFTISAKKLKSLSGIQRRRETPNASTQDTGIQRRHDPERSEEIKKFVHFGYPWSEMSEQKRDLEEFKNLRKPGWLPTSIVINILEEGNQRKGKTILPQDLVRLTPSVNELVTIELPEKLNEKWTPCVNSLHPFEVIDGQHRLWAFEDDIDDNFELPVVAFHGLDISWQAYLFWTINIKPKKINPSLAFDLYPLLRAQDWLDHFNGHVIYREARAQEIVELLWSNVKSPWHNTINMLGDRGIKNQVSQAAWIRSLLATYIKTWNSPDKQLGGFFGVSTGDQDSIVPWTRIQQAAFLMLLGNYLKEAITKTNAPWKATINELKDSELGFYGAQSLLTTDQGIRGLLDVSNLLLCAAYDDLKDSYNSWFDISDSENIQDATKQYDSLSSTYDFVTYLKDIANILAEYDWRSYTAIPDSEKSAKDLKAGFRGSGGYKQIRNDLLSFMEKHSTTHLIKSSLLKIKTYIS